MREIIFRGKRIGNGELVEGCLVKTRYNSYIVPFYDEFKFAPSFKSVIPQTIGQFTGLTDKTGTKIFEGDIIRVLEDKSKKTDNNPYCFAYGDKGEVIWEQRYCAFSLYNRELEESEDIGNLIRDDFFNFCEVIGNIHDNPELLTEI